MSLLRRLAGFRTPAIVVAALLSGAGGFASAQTTGRPGLVVKVAPVTVPSGGRAETRVTLDIQKGYRIVAPDSPWKRPQPPILAIDAAGGVFVEPVSWPAGTLWQARGEDPEVKVYEGRLELKVIVHAPAKTGPQEITLRGRLRYQAIHEEFFEKVVVMPVSIPVTVAAPAAPSGTAATRR